MKRSRAKRFISRLIATLSIVILTVDVALALVSGQPKGDTFVSTTEPSASNTHNGENLIVAASGIESSACSSTETVYLQWNVDLAGGNVDTATLTLTATYATKTDSAKLTLYQASDAWEEDTLKFDNAPDPPVGSVIETIDAPPTGMLTTIVTFSNPNLVTYINAQAAGDKVASFALRFSSGCAAGEFATVTQFADKESGDGGPYLLMLNNNAAHLRTLQTTYANSKWLAGVGPVLIALGSAAFLRHISRQRRNRRALSKVDCQMAKTDIRHQVER